MGKLRVIGGTYRSRIIEFTDDIEGLRPTPDRVRETLFNWLGQDLTAKSCLDLFSGSGALGFEAISRNASDVVMIEINSKVIANLLKNSAKLKCNNLSIVKGNSLDYLMTTDKFFDVIFLDPPYDSDLLIKSLQIILTKPNLNHTIIYIEYKDTPDLSGYSVLKQAKSGIVQYSLIKKFVESL